MASPVFAIIIPCYNSARTIRRAIESCVCQTWQDFEIVVIDDERSTDNVASQLALYQNGERPIRLIQNHRGTAAAARNTGVRLAKARFVAFLDADDEFLPDKLDLYRQHLEQHPKIQLLYSQSYIDRDVGRLWVKPYRALGELENIFEYLFVSKGWIHPSTVVIEREMALRHPFQENLTFGDDVQFAADLWRNGIRIDMIGSPLAIYHDPYLPERLSQSPVFFSGSAPQHTNFMRWVEAQRPYMSERAYLAYRAFFRSRFVARAAPRDAARDIWLAYRNGAISGVKSLAQAIQTFSPHLYRRSADFVARYWGRDRQVAVAYRRRKV